ncbi:terpene synthase family protein [Biscogniauxia marginata]|nr:terpene synthase family protein [Biscogniauxia marginata]
MESNTSQIPSATQLGLAARSLVQQAIECHDKTYGFGSMSASVYDTAWVSLVSKSDDNGRCWLFPQCFHYICMTQLDDGSWGPKVSQVDGILNTAASLLALQVHVKDPLQIQDISHQELEKRIAVASEALQTQLSEWNVATSTHVGFEIIVPAMLGLLEREGISFSFPGKDKLRKLNSIKMSRFKPELLYSQYKTTMIHSLESFAGKIDFDRVSHHKVHGAMMASPSATAAYLINSSQWDEEAESYLRHLAEKDSEIIGGVPSAYPSTYFEYTWLLSTLLRSSFSASDLGGPFLDRMVDTIAKAFQGGNGKIGFAHSLEADVDDTAKGLLSLSLLDAKDRGKTNPSFSANCNVLLALIHERDPIRFLPQILKTAQFLCTYWWDTDDSIRDKWNLSHLYPTMLLVEALSDLLSLMDKNIIISEAFHYDTKARISITIFQACFRTLISQRNDASWNGSIEQTSYGILILSEARHITFLQELQAQLASSIASAARFISSPASRSTGFDYIWIEKVTYGSAFLTEIYRLAALKSALSFTSSKEEIGASLGINISKVMMRSYIDLFRETPLFSSMPVWQLRGSFLEAALFQRLLRTRRLTTFPRTDMEEDKYFDIIPFTWTACNNRSRAFASSSFLFEMMTISFLNYQADEHMEAVAGPSFATDLDELHVLIDDLFCLNQNRVETVPYGVEANGLMIKAIDPLSKFVNQVLQSPRVVRASKADRQILATELRVFLQAHVTQHVDNTRFRNQTQLDQYQPSDGFFHWVRTTSADHTSCPYSFAYVSCLLSSSLLDGAECFPTVTQKYFANAACRHLASMCRIYNDYGSIRRDSAERNLNSVNFPEFAVRKVGLQDAKKNLFKLAGFERGCLEGSLQRLEAEAGQSGKRKLHIFRMFCDVTDLYGQIYVVKDIASSMKVNCGGHNSGTGQNQAK